VPQNLRNYIDFESYARDAGFDGVNFVRVEGDVWVFDR
jgi:antirestriction protein